MNLYLLQTLYILGAAILLPFSPFLYMQGQYARKKIGTLPGAEGDERGTTSGTGEPLKLLVIGESTVAGIGIPTHRAGLSGQFSEALAAKFGRPVEWLAIGKNGVTARRTIEELFPQIPNEHFDFVLFGVGGNDVLKLSTPVGWRRSMTELLGMMRERYPSATMFMTNAPAVHLSPALPQPIKLILGSLSLMHDRNSREFTREWERVYYFHRPDEVPDDFFVDGIHPSESGYTVWSQRMVQFFTEHYQWHQPNDSQTNSEVS